MCASVAGTSAKSEGERLHTNIKELDLELSIDDRRSLSDELIEARFPDDTIAAAVHIDAVCSLWRTPVDRHAKAYALPALPGAAMTRWTSRA